LVVAVVNTLGLVMEFTIEIAFWCVKVQSLVKAAAGVTVSAEMDG
jgi:hypothetical protein